MVKVILYEDGTYSVEDIESYYATQELVGWTNGKRMNIYHCPKSQWKKYLFKLLSPEAKDIDKQIEKLNKRKQKIIE